MLSESEVRAAVARAEHRFIDACISSTDEQWQFQPVGVGDRAWRIPQVVEHVTGANQGLLRRMRDLVTTSPRGGQVPDFEDEDIPFIFYGGGGGAPPGLGEPTGRAPRDESVRAFATSMRAILDWYDELELDLREYALVHPAFGLFDGAQWMLFVAVHTQQHRGQILDVKLASDTAGSAVSTL